MMIRSLTLQNFKVIGSKPETFRFAPITLLFGPNSAGKSTVLQALVYLREILLHRNLDPDLTELGGDWLDLGGFENLVHGHKRISDVTLGLSFMTGPNAEFLNLFNDDVFERWAPEGFSFDEFFDSIQTLRTVLTITWSAQKRKPYCSRFEIEANGETLLVIEADADGTDVFISQLNLEHELLRDIGTEENPEVPTFAGFFWDVVDSERVHIDPLQAYAKSMGNRPFMKHRVTELEEMVGSIATTGEELDYRSVALLEKISDELQQRRQRSAMELQMEVRSLLSQAPEWSHLEQTRETRINIYDLSDALPHGFEFLNFDEEIWLEYGETDREKKRFIEYVLSTLIIGAFKSAARIVSQMTYLGPLRQLPPRQFLPRKTTHTARWSSGMAAWEALHEADEEFVEELNTWLGPSRLNTGYEVLVKRYRELETEHPLLAYLKGQADPDQQALIAEMIEKLEIKTKVSLRESRSGLDVMPQDVGVGISQLLPVVVSAMKQNLGLVAVEQPELHVHPAIQVELGDLFAAYALTRRKYFLLETHSEHLLLRLLRRLRESTEAQGSIDQQDKIGLKRDDLSIIYLEGDEFGLKVTPIELDEEGEFATRWPRGFFAERRKELM